MTWKTPLCVALVALSACSSDATYYYGEHVADLTLKLTDATEGIHPSVTVLADPNNPFAHSVMAADTKWQVQSGGSPALAFYAWATVLAREPYGEPQYYAAFNLKAAAEAGQGEVDALAALRAQAIRAFQAVLDDFPDAVTYAADGKTTYELATPSYEAILALGGTPEHGWILVTTVDGKKMAVKRAGQ